jgi:hypothetical protein
MIFFPAAALVILAIGFSLIMREIWMHERRRK